MTPSIRQQIVITGVGGQGVLFITRLLAEAAIVQGLPVFTSETHGMAQRGGIVISHLKVGAFQSPLIRPGQADGLLALKSGNLDEHQFFLSPSGWAVVNAPTTLTFKPDTTAIDADAIAAGIQQPRSVNLVLLGRALALGENGLFCSQQTIMDVIRARLTSHAGAALDALQAGFAAICPS